MVGQSILTFRGLTALIDALQTNRQIKVHSYKASTQDINPLDPNMTSLQAVWKTGTLAGYIPVNQNTVEFIIDIPQEEATNYSRTFGLYLEDGTLFMLAKPPYPFPPGLRQVMKVQLVFQNATQIINFQYVPFYETQQDMSLLDAFSSVSIVLQRLREDVEDLKNLKPVLQNGLSRTTNLETQLKQTQQNLLALASSFYVLAEIVLENLDILHRRYES